MMDWYGDHMSGGGWALMAFVMVVFAAALIVAVLALLRRWDAAPQPGASAASFTPEQVLAERFARGEIEETDYAGRLGALREHRRN